jgi:choline dehydrogenase-like flavoprotein
MIVDFTESGAAAVAGRSYDICIVGTGPAGMTLALNLARSLSVLLLEGGGPEFSDESQQNYKGTIVGHSYYDLDAARLRFLGGTSNHWGGRCQTLGEHDFEVRSYVAHSGWPIAKKDLDPYIKRAAEIVDARPDDQTSPGFRARFDQAFVSSGFARPYDFMWSPPTRFGPKYRPTLEAAANITCLLRANLTDIQLNEAGTAATGVEIAGYDGNGVTVPVRRLVVAAGGMENPRILLNCNRQIKFGIGNQHDLVGRYFAEHPEHLSGWLVLEDDLKDAILNVYPDAEGGNHERKIYYAAAPEFLQRHEILNFLVKFIPITVQRQRNVTFSQQLRQAVCGPDWISSSLDYVFSDGAPTCYDGIFEFATEQAPNPDSRILLAEQTDRFGWRRIALDWRTLPIDKRTFTVAATEVATHFVANDLGRARVKEWILADDPADTSLSETVEGSYHHMGTTRMADDPREGVVDRNCRVHGMENLYIAGSSLFPTYGFINPTFTIVQLALRLADHLNAT